MNADVQSTIPKSQEKRRIHFMDELRGFAIILMVAYHAFFTIGYLYNAAWGQFLFIFFEPVEPLFAGLFIFICGISCRLSHSNVKRGGLLLLIALGITAALLIFLPEEKILFGILHFLAVAILLFALLRPLLDKVPVWAGLIVCGLLFLLTRWVPVYEGAVFGIKGLLSWPIPQSLESQLWLYPLGFGNIDTADYFPLLPWIFCFLAGTFCGVWAKQGRFPSWMYRRYVPFLSFCGRHTLLIYVVHQPIILALCWAVFNIIRLFG